MSFFLILVGKTLHLYHFYSKIDIISLTWKTQWTFFEQQLYLQCFRAVLWQLEWDPLITGFLCLLDFSLAFLLQFNVFSCFNTQNSIKYSQKPVIHVKLNPKVTVHFKLLPLWAASNIPQWLHRQNTFLNVSKPLKH